ncbi:MAG: hypothetical protein JXB18_13185, partial [Sedimentisphaerales bacterium]|nr:hypothetical protein [Sedimentisphaerales bacterium]
MEIKNVLIMVMLLCALGLVARAEVVSTISSEGDTYLNGSTTYGDSDHMYLLGGSSDYAGYLRFDLGAINVNTVLDAQLVLRNSPTPGRNDSINNARFTLYGLNNVAGNTSQDWDESTFNEDGAGAEWTNAIPMDLTGERVTNLDADDGVAVTEDIVRNGDYWVAGAFTITISGQALIDFLQARAEDDGLATFILGCEDGGTRGFGIATKENAIEEYRPVLILTYIAGGALNPQPANGTVITDLDLSQLCWDNMNVEVADVWFGAGADVNEVNYQDHLTMIGSVAAPAQTSCVDIPAEMHPLAVPETYYWVVETYGYPASDPNHLGEPNELLSNTLWTFSTSSVPVAQTAPANQIKLVGETTSFSVQFLALTPVINSVWYRNGSPVDIGDPDITVSISDDGSNLYTVTLTIANAAAADEGVYDCVGINSGGSSLLSDSAFLKVNRLLAQYAFDGSLDDNSSNSAPSGTALDTLGDPNSLLAVPAAIHYVTGADGIANSALYLDPNEYVDFGVEGYPKAGVLPNGTGGGLDEGTVVFWVKPNVGNVQQTVLGNFNDSGTGFLTLLQADQDFDLYIRGADGTALANHPAGRPNRPEYDLTDGNWHMMAACWNGNTSTLYVDGQWV